MVNTGEHELVEELFEQIKPGLSAYASDPHKVKHLPGISLFVLLCALLVELQENSFLVNLN